MLTIPLKITRKESSEKKKKTKKKKKLLNEVMGSTCLS